jgi:phosphoserine aminotransferase
MELALWSLLGSRPVTMLAWESFGAGWVTDVVKQLRLDAEVRTADLPAALRQGETARGWLTNSTSGSPLRDELRSNRDESFHPCDGG